MNLLELFLIAVGLSMDAFAVSICTGLTMSKVTMKKSLTVGLYFGVFQAAMPLIGYVLGTRFADEITAYDHWIAFIMLGFIGGKMMIGGFKKTENSDKKYTKGTSKDKKHWDGECSEIEETSLLPAKMLSLALATSIDALAVGISFAFLKVNIVPAVFFIGIITLILSMIGVKIGNVFGIRFKSKAEISGGVVLILMGLKILFEHLGIIIL